MKQTFLTLALGSVIALSACSVEEAQPSQPSSFGSSEQSPTINNEGLNVYTQWPAAEFLPDAELTSGTNVYAENVVIAIDTSGSMDGNCSGISNKMATAKEAAVDFISSIQPDASIGLVTFGGNRSQVVLPLGPNNHRAAIEAVELLRYGGGTPMADALRVSHQELSRVGGTQYGYGKYSLVLLGDGEPTVDGERATIYELDQIAQKTPINLTTIGFCADIDVLDRPVINFQTADTLDELKRAFNTALLAESEDLTGGF